MRSRRVFYHFLCWAFCFLPCTLLKADVLDFQVPAQPADSALLAFSKQAQVEVLFSFDELHKVQSIELTGRYEPEEALNRLLQGTGFVARRSGKKKFVVTPLTQITGSLQGRLLISGRIPATGIRVTIPDTQQTTTTDIRGDFSFPAVPPGTYQLVATGDGLQPLQITDAQVQAHRVTTLETQEIPSAHGLAQLEPFVVRDRSGRNGFFDRDAKLLPPRTAVGNLDLRRTEDDALAYTVYDRRQLIRSGVVNLNEFLQRELLDSDAATRPPEQDGGKDSFISTSANLSLRGYGTEETVILVNGRRLPEILYSGSTPQLPDVNFIPLSLVQQIEVLPVSASALYTGNAVGGVINIVLRPDVDAAASEVTLTYINALGGYDAPQSSASLLHAQTLLGGKLRVRLNASITATTPPVEAELKYHQNRDELPAPLEEPIHRATPNIWTVNLDPLFGPGTAPVTSVAPGADGQGGLAAFSGREGLRNLNFFDSPGGLAPSPNSIDYPYGRKQRRDTYFGSVVYDATPWLQLGIDGTYSQTVANRGYDVVIADLRLDADSPLSPFSQDVFVSLNETAPLLGQDYSEARLNFASLVLGVLLKLPKEWQLSLDVQYAHNTTQYRGLAGADPTRWQRLVDEGRYNPLRDTQIFGPPPAFYDEVLIYRGRRGSFVTLGNYHTIDAALRATNESIVLPTGVAVVNFGTDYRLNNLARFEDERRYSDGSLAMEPIHWMGRTLQRYSAFGELQAPLVPERWLPRWLRKVETDLAARYVAANSSKESNLAPTFGLKLDWLGGFSVRGSLTTSNRLPTPYMSRQVVTPSGLPGGIDLVSVLDPVRKERYLVQATETPDPNLRTESAVTQTAGAIFQRGHIHRFRASVDFVDTQKTNELFVLDPQTVLNLESILPYRVQRNPLAPGDIRPLGRVSVLATGNANLARRHSQNWNSALTYSWTQCWGGVLDLYARLLYFQRYDVQRLPTSPIVDEVNRPDSSTPQLLSYRSNFGASWSNHRYGLGVDGHYFHSRHLPEFEWASQGAEAIDPFWQFDVYTQTDLSHWLPWKSSRYGLRAQVRVNNVLDTPYPYYANDSAASGVQAYGDWRGRVYSLSVTATF